MPIKITNIHSADEAVLSVRENQSFKKHSWKSHIENYITRRVQSKQRAKCLNSIKLDYPCNEKWFVILFEQIIWYQLFNILFFSTNLMRARFRYSWYLVAYTFSLWISVSQWCQSIPAVIHKAVSKIMTY